MFARRGLSRRNQAEACNTDATPTQPHRNCNTHRTKNNTTNVVVQQNSRKLLMMDILMSETCWAHKKWNKIASDIRLVFYSSTVTMMHGPINITLNYIYLWICRTTVFLSAILSIIKYCRYLIHFVLWTITYIISKHTCETCRRRLCGTSCLDGIWKPTVSLLLILVWGWRSEVCWYVMRPSPF